MPFRLRSRDVEDDVDAVIERCVRLAKAGEIVAIDHFGASAPAGVLYKQFAITIAISTIISTINSLTLSPALAALSSS